MTEKSNQIKDEGALSKYFSMMLHIDDDDLDPFEYRLLGHYRKVCGMSPTRTCFEETKTTAEACKMGERKVRSARTKLAALGRINIQGREGKSLSITILDCMGENVNRYSHPLQKSQGSNQDTPGKNARGPLAKVQGDQEYKKGIQDSDSSLPSSEKNRGEAPPKFTNGLFYGINHRTKEIQIPGVPSEERFTSLDRLPPEWLSISGDDLNNSRSYDDFKIIRVITVTATKRPRDLVFDAIALGSFGLSKVKGKIGGRIGAIATEVTDCMFPGDEKPSKEQLEGLASKLVKMYAWYKEEFPDRKDPVNKPEAICKYLHLMDESDPPKPELVDDPDNPGRKITPAKLRSNQIQKAYIESHYGKSS